MSIPRPLGPRCIVRRIVPGEQKGSIIMPDSVKAKHRWAEVGAIGVSELRYMDAGPGGAGMTPWDPVKIGQRVLLPKHACDQHFADKFDHDGEELLVLEYKEILAVAQ